MDIANSVYFISGGASGLGEAAARRLVAGGAAGVAIADLNLEAASSLASELGDAALAVRVDVQNSDEISAGMETVIARFGRLDAAINCAGIGWAERTLDRENKAASIENYRRVININLVGTFDVTRIAATHIAKNEPNESGERGVIVLTASLAAYDGQIGQAAYSASKGAVGVPSGDCAECKEGRGAGATRNKSGRWSTPDMPPLRSAEGEVEPIV